MTVPSLRKLEFDLQVNKTTLHNWKKNRPKLFEFIIESYKNREVMKKHLELLMEQKEIIEKEIDLTRNRIS
ncbi:MAG: hypothetical protein KA438_02805 [Aliarcobacter sp.]|jgi:hypothetical protein|nr:hypothetical protein [Aliarcobacter sp.]MBP6713636.1 hypothetical protein [Aliarcobacter sp.]MBP7225528.1 hypothetical protein [Aliarcobacter sp.]MDX9961700.1 hypothetical protein [Aliarcobacter sp.]